MKIDTKRFFETKVDFSATPGFRTARVRSVRAGVDLQLGNSPSQAAYLALEIDEARFLADLLNEAADVAQENEESFKNVPTDENGDDTLADIYPLTSPDLAGTPKAPLNLRTSVTFPVSASDVHGWSKDGGVRI